VKKHFLQISRSLLLLGAGLLGGEAHALPWVLKPPCESTAGRYLVGPELEEARHLDHPGARTWNFHKMLAAEKSGTLSLECAAAIWKQAEQDATDYWKVVGEKYDCLTPEGELPRAKPASCPSSKWDSVEANLHYIVYVRGLHEHQGPRAHAGESGSNCNIPESPDAIQTLGNDLAAIVGPEPRAPRRIAEGNIGLDAEELFASDTLTPPPNSGISTADLLAPHPCSEVPPEMRGSVPDGWRYLRDQTWACVKGAAHGIYDTLESTISGLWDLLVLGKDIVVGAGSAVIDLAKAMYGGSVTDLVTEWAFNAEAAYSKLVNALMSIPEAIYTWLGKQGDYFMCLNETAQREYICKAATRVIGEIGLTAVGVNLAKAGKLPAVTRAATWVEDSVKATRLGAAAIKAAAWYKNLRILDSVPSGLRWMRDASLGSDIAVQGEKVFVRLEGKVAEVVNGRIVTAIRKGVALAEGAAASTYKYLRTVPDSVKSGLDRGLSWVRDSSNGLYVAYKDGKAYVKQAGMVLEVARADAAEKIRSGVARLSAAYEKRVAQYRDDLTEWRARKAEAAKPPSAPPPSPPKPRPELPAYAKEVKTPSGSRVVFEGADAERTYSIAKQHGLLPSEVVEVGGQRITVGKLFDMGEGRVGALIEVEIDGVKYARTVYRSNSQGVFRVLPARNSGMGFVPGYDKAVGEAALDLPPQLQSRLAQKMREETSVVMTKAEQTSLVDGSVRHNRNFVEYSEYHDSPGYLGKSTSSEHLVAEQLDRPLKTPRGKPMAKPAEVRILTPGHEPNFSAPSTSYKTSTATAGEVEALVYPSKDGSLSYTVYKGSDGKIWVASVQDSAAGLTTHGTARRIMESGEILTPRWEYTSQLPSNYMGATNSVLSEYSDSWSYLREMPVIQEWYRARGIPIP
jgi:hypothetical protein